MMKTRLASVAAVLALAVAGVAAVPQDAKAWWHRGFGVRIFVPPVVVAPPVLYPAPVYAPPPVVYVPPPPPRYVPVRPPVWVPPHWEGRVWVQGHWA